MLGAFEAIQSFDTSSREKYSSVWVHDCVHLGGVWQMARKKQRFRRADLAVNGVALCDPIVETNLDLSLYIVVHSQSLKVCCALFRSINAACRERKISNILTRTYRRPIDLSCLGRARMAQRVRCAILLLAIFLLSSFHRRALSRRARGYDPSEPPRALTASPSAQISLSLC